MGCPQLGVKPLDIQDALEYRCAFILEGSNKFNNYMRFPASTPFFLPVYLHHAHARLAPDYVARPGYITRLSLWTRLPGQAVSLDYIARLLPMYSPSSGLAGGSHIVN